MAGTTKQPRAELQGAMEAPILVFDGVPIFGVMPGMARMTLSAYVQDEDGTGGVGVRRVVVANLRCNEHALASLRGALDGIAAMLAAPPDQKLN